MHERALMDDVVRKVEAVALAEGGRVARVRVRLGVLSHFTPEHFREHFADAARGSLADGAAVEAEVVGAATDEHADGVVVESVELALP